MDFVYHLAAEFGRLNGEEYYDALVDQRHRHAEHPRASAPPRLQANLRELVGDLRRQARGRPARGDPAPASIIQHNDYATTKWVNEVQIMNFERRFDSPIVRLRFFNAYGPGSTTTTTEA